MIDFLTSLAGRQGGFVTRGQMIASGGEDRHLRALLRAGTIVRIRHGSYSPTATWRTLTAEERLVVRSRAVLAHLGPGFALSHTSAAALHGLDLFGLDRETVHVTALGRHTGRREAGVVVHEGGVDEADLVQAGGVLAVRAPRAVVETACLATIEGTIVTASSALHLGLTTQPELAAIAQSFVRWKGIRAARLGLAMSDGHCENAGEARSLHLCWEQGLPRPELQVPIYDGPDLVGVVDAGWMDWNHVGEFDGMVKYGRLNPWSEDTPTTLVEEKVREDRIRGTRRGMSRWIWRDLSAHLRARTGARLRAALEQSRRLYCTPSVR